MARKQVDEATRKARAEARDAAMHTLADEAGKAKKQPELQAREPIAPAQECDGPKGRARLSTSQARYAYANGLATIDEIVAEDVRAHWFVRGDTQVVHVGTYTRKSARAKSWVWTPFFAWEYPKGTPSRLAPWAKKRAKTRTRKSAPAKRVTATDTAVVREALAGMDADELRSLLDKMLA